MKNIINKIPIILLFALFANACKSPQTVAEDNAPAAAENTVTLTAAQLKNAALTIGTLSTKNIGSVLKVNGVIDVPPQNMVSISAPLGGYLKTTQLLPGMHVRKGEVIATLEDVQYIQLQQDYLLTKAKMDYAELDYQRQKTLNESQASSDKAVQQAAAERTNLRITLAALAEKLQLIGKKPQNITENSMSRSTNIYAPIDGFVTKVNVNIGKYIAPTDVLFELVNPTDIHLALRIFEKDIDQLFIGQNVVAFTNNKPDNRHDCKILLLGKDVSAEHSINVHCHFAKYDKTLLPGTYMNAEIKTNSQNTFALPTAAIVAFENKKFVFVQQSETKFEMVEVETGGSENDFIQIKNGDIIKNKNIVLKNAYTLLMKMKNEGEE